MGCTVDWFEKRSRLTPEHIAIVDSDTGHRWSYQEIEQRALRLASFLRKQGVNKGDRVALLSPNHLSYFDLLFACLKLGAIFVPLNWRLAAPELLYILRDCRPKLIAVHPDLASYSQVGTWKQAIGCEQLIVGGAEYEDILRAEQTTLVAAEVHSDDPYVVIYTGGTTGKPKGVVLSHDSIFWNSVNTVISWHLTSKEITPTYLPMFHTGGLNALSLPVLQAGGTVILAKEFAAEKAIDLLTRERCTIVLMVPTMYHMLVHSPSFADAVFPTMHTFLSGGAPCPLSIYQSFAEKGLAFKEGYGLTEAGPNNFYINPQVAMQKRGSVGLPMMYNEIKVVNECGEEANPHEIGELWLKGTHLFHSYWNQPELTASTFTNGWFRTGDLAKRDDEGYTYIMGRKKEMIITGGENVYPLEVEHLLSQHAAVKEVTVMGIPDEKWGEAVAAAVVLHTGCTVSDDELILHCKSSIAAYKAPKRIIFVAELPITSVGKIDKNQLIHMLR